MPHGPLPLGPRCCYGHVIKDKGPLLDKASLGGFQRPPQYPARFYSVPTNPACPLLTMSFPVIPLAAVSGRQPAQRGTQHYGGRGVEVPSISANGNVSPGMKQKMTLDINKLHPLHVLQLLILTIVGVSYGWF